jgi:hypothetical protein
MNPGNVVVGVETFLRLNQAFAYLDELAFPRAMSHPEDRVIFT